MADLKTTFAGLTLKNPVNISSSGLTNSAAKNAKLEAAGAGAIVLKSLFEEQIMMEADRLRNPSYYPEGSDYLAEYIRNHKLAEYLEYIFDMNQPKFIEMGLDKSEIYVIYMEYYSEKKKLKKYDDYAMKLYKIVAKRDHENLEMMERLLADIYNVAVERMDMHKYPQMCEYIALGWDICQTFNSIPNCLQEAYEAFRSAASNLEMI